MSTNIQPTEDMIDAAAEAIANTREARKGRPNVGNLDFLPYEYREQLKEEAEAAIIAALEWAPWATKHIQV